MDPALLELMGSPVDYHWSGSGERESTLTPEEQEIARKLLEGLTDESREILLASVDRSERKAADALGMPRSTYRGRLKRAREEAKALLRLWAQP